MCDKIEDCWMSNLIEDIEDSLSRLENKIKKLEESSNR